MGILKEKIERPDSLYTSYDLNDESDEFLEKCGFATLPIEYDTEFDFGKNSLTHMFDRMSFADKNYFEVFTNAFDREPYRI